MMGLNPLGIALMNSLGMSGEKNMTAPMPQPTAAPTLSRGQLIAGVLADALAGAAGRPGMFAAQQGQQREQQREEAVWSRRRQEAAQDWTQREKWKLANPDPSPLVRDAQAWQGMSPEQQAAYAQMKQAGAGDPDVFVTLPNGQVYAGPKSGLTAALTGGASVAPKPVGKLTPMSGGPTLPASGGFR